ncbi:MAG: hypothetical protein R3C14_22550 [Caldilineaceae bacterium]
MNGNGLNLFAHLAGAATLGTTNTDFTYDVENRLVSVNGGATASFVYDGDNQRVKGTAGGVTTAKPPRVETPG